MRRSFWRHTNFEFTKMKTSLPYLRGLVYNMDMDVTLFQTCAKRALRVPCSTVRIAICGTWGLWSFQKQDLSASSRDCASAGVKKMRDLLCLCCLLPRYCWYRLWAQVPLLETTVIPNSPALNFAFLLFSEVNVLQCHNNDGKEVHMPFKDKEKKVLRCCNNSFLSTFAPSPSQYARDNRIHEAKN